MRVGNTDVDVYCERFGKGLVFLRDPQCPWVCKESKLRDALDSLSERTFIENRDGSARSNAYQALCDILHPIATDGAARTLYEEQGS